MGSSLLWTTSTKSTVLRIITGTCFKLITQELSVINQHLPVLRCCGQVRDKWRNLQQFEVV